MIRALKLSRNMEILIFNLAEFNFETLKMKIIPSPYGAPYNRRILRIICFFTLGGIQKESIHAIKI